MLKTMRANAGSWIIKFILLAIVVVFVFWGVGSYNTQKSSRIAVVNGETISFDDFNKAHYMMVENLKQQFGGRLDENMLRNLNIKQQVLTQMVNNKLLVEEAHRLNLSVSMEELAEYIRNIPAFQTNGAFDNQRYRFVLNSMRRTPEEFELLQKEAMLLSKLKTFLYSTVNVTDTEARAWFEYNQTMVNIDYVLFSPDDYKGIEPTEEEVFSYFEENKEAYRTQPKLEARYFRFSPDEYALQMEVSKEEIQNYYNENRESFLEPKTVEARHILVKAPQDAAPEIIKEKRIEAENIMKMARQGKEGFAELAETYSEGPSKSNGGYLGTFQKDQMVAPFAEAAFSLNAGDISDPVQTRFGWHIIKVEKVNEERQKSLEEVSAEIEKTLAQREAEYLAYDQAERVYDASFDDDNLKSIAESIGFELHTTDFFTKAGPSGMAQPAKFAETAFSMEIDEISDIETIGSDFYILQVIDKKPAVIPEFKAVQSKARENLIKKMKEEKAKKEAEAFLAHIKAPATDENQEFEAKELVTTGLFKRNDTIPTIGNEKTITDAAFLLTKENPFPDKALKADQGYYVIRLKERKMPEKTSFALEESDIKDKLIQKKKEKTFNALVQGLREKAEISISEGFYRY